MTLTELENVSGSISAKPFMFTVLTLFGLLGVSAASQVHAADFNQNDSAYEANEAKGTDYESNFIIKNRNEDEVDTDSESDSITKNRN